MLRKLWLANIARETSYLPRTGHFCPGNDGSKDWRKN
jgi:hypothetical protein